MIDTCLSFFSLCETSITGSYVGAILLTDTSGFPVEFKCTHSLKPTKIQRSLYGEKLKPFLALNLCALPLHKSLVSAPSIVFVNQPYSLSIRKDILTPVLYVHKADKSINKTDKEDCRIILKHKKNLYSPVIVECHPDLPEDVTNSSQLLTELFNKFDLSECFERISKSVEIMGNTDNKFK